jgi:hypothetical protein
VTKNDNNLGETYSETYRHFCEVVSVVRMYKETLAREGQRKAKEHIQSFILQVEKHRGNQSAQRLRNDALEMLKTGDKK